MDQKLYLVVTKMCVAFLNLNVVFATTMHMITRDISKLNVKIFPLCKIVNNDV